MSADAVVVWGNCQAAPIAALLREPLAAQGLDVVSVPPVFLATEEEVDQVRQTVARSAYLISQPIRDEYRIPGCGTAQLAEHLPADGRLVTFANTFHTGAFPYQVNAHGGDGARVDAPLTDYHDLRAIVAAERGMSVQDAVAWWPSPDADTVRTLSDASLTELRRREADLDVATSEFVDAPDALWTMTHPTNRTLGRIVALVLRALGVDADVSVPQREYLGARRAPVEAAVAKAHGWAADAVHEDWVVDNAPLPLDRLLETQLAFYRARPDIAVDTRTRQARRLAALDL